MPVTRLEPKSVAYPLLRGFGLAIAFWIVDAAADAFVLRGGTFVGELFTPSAPEIWMRSVIGLLAIGFCIYADRQRHGQRSLNRQLRFTRSAVENAAEAMYTIDVGGRFVDVNQMACERLGYSREELLEMTVVDINPDYPLEVWTTHWDELRRDRKLHFESEHRTKDGRVIPVEISKSYVEYEGAAYAFAFVTDISERRLREAALRTGENSLVKAQQISHLGNWEFHLATGGLWGSDELLRIVGIGVDDDIPTLESFVADYVCPEDHPLIEQSYGDALATGAPRPIDFRLRKTADRDERYVRAEAEVIRDSDGTPTKVIGTLQDVTLQKKTELALRESEAQFRVLSDSSPAMVAIFQGEKLSYANRALELATGYSNEQLLQMHLTQLAHPDERALILERSKRRQAGEPVPSRYELRFCTAAGKTRWMDFSANVIDYQGSPGVLAIGIDITERKHAEETLQQRDLELAHVSRLSTMGEMVAGIAHEINQPLYAIANFATASATLLASGDADKASHARELCEQISAQAVRAGGIIRGLRDFVKKSDGELATFDIDEVVRESLELMKPSLRRYGASTSLQLAGSGIQVHADRIQIQQVIVNLVLNALDAMAHLDAAERRLTVRTARSQQKMHLIVQDCGFGVSPDALKSVFDAFYSTKEAGMGMGLAVSRTIVERYGGRIWMESIDAGGTSVQFTLPLVGESAPVAASPMTAATG